jgi:hypothetical protein
MLFFQKINYEAVKELVDKTCNWKVEVSLVLILLCE